MRKGKPGGPEDDAPSVPEAPEPSIEDGDPRGNETVLVAEDNDVVRELTVRMLRRRGYTVIEAADGHAALEAAERHGGKIDLLIADLVMPAMSGATLGSRLAAAIPGLKVLYVSGYFDRGSSSQELVSPNAAWLQKPFPPQVLARKVREILDS